MYSSPTCGCRNQRSRADFTVQKAGQIRGLAKRGANEIAFDGPPPVLACLRPLRYNLHFPGTLLSVLLQGWCTSGQRMLRIFLRKRRLARGRGGSMAKIIMHECRSRRQGSASPAPAARTPPSALHVAVQVDAYQCLESAWKSRSTRLDLSKSMARSTFDSTRLGGQIEENKGSANILLTSNPCWTIHCFVMRHDDAPMAPSMLRELPTDGQVCRFIPERNEDLNNQSFGAALGLLCLACMKSTTSR